jgi:S-adenosylmethionine:tRNA ribosyltransferase-isomerase
VPAETARIFNAARAEGRCVIAVGTIVVRALETVIYERGVTSSGEGWTRVIVTPERGIRSLNGTITGSIR